MNRVETDTAEISAIEAAILAGFFDADGTVGVYMRQTGKRAKKSGLRWKYPMLAVSVSGIHRASIERYKSAFGGNVYLENKARRQFAKNDLWTWHASWHVARVALRTMLPYLLVKKDQAVEALRLPLHERGYKYSEEERAMREEIVNTVKSLKRAIAS